MNKLWITLIRSYIKLGLYFYYKKITVAGKENIPTKGATLFVSNHPNSLLDPLIVGTTNGRSTYFLTRAGVFKKKLIIKFFNSVQMLPIYRVRDGWENLSKNQAIFDKCISILKNKQALVIFPEGSHCILRRVRPLSKGFTRILFGAFEQHSDLKIKIVPVGLNYDVMTQFPARVAIYYGKPIDANQYWNPKDIYTSTNQIKEVVRHRMKELTTHIEETSTYNQTIDSLINSRIDFLNPDETNAAIEELNLTQNREDTYVKKSQNRILYYIFIANSLVPWLVWREKLKPKIKEAEFISTFRFAISITLFPIWYIIQTLVVYYNSVAIIALLYFISSLILGLVTSRFYQNKKGDRSL